MQKQKTISEAVICLICCFIAIQVFPPVLVLDGTSLRHFLIALFDIVSLGFMLSWLGKYKVQLIDKRVLSMPLMVVWGVLLVWMGVSMLWTINPVEGLAVWNRWLVVILSAVLLSAFLLYENKAFKALVICSIVIATINVLSCIVCYYLFDVHISQRNNLKLNGFYGNKNIFAVALLFKLPFLYYAFLRYKGFVKWYSLGLIFLIPFCLMMLSTRSCFIGLAMQVVVLLVYGVFSMWKYSKPKRAVLPFVIVIASIVAGFLAGNKFIEYNYDKYASKSVQNNYTIEARVKTIAEGNSKGRLLIWKNTSEIIKQKPVLGYGVGNHKIAIMKVECAKKHDYIVSDHAHNDFLEMFSELGIFGVIVYALTYLFAAIATIRQVFAKKVSEIYRLRALTGGMLILIYLNDALFNFPLERADCQIYLALGIALLVSNAVKMKRREACGISRSVFVGLCVVCVPLFALETTHCYSSIMQKMRIKQHNGDKSITLSAKQWERRTPLFPNLDESTHPRSVNIAERYASEKRYREAIDLLLADNSNPYYSLREYRLANYYNKIDKSDSAAYWAGICMKMKPLCYSPVRVLVSIAGKEQKPQKQLELIDAYLAIYDKEPLAWEDKINILLGQNRKEEASEVLQQAAEILPKSKKIAALQKKISQQESPK